MIKCFVRLAGITRSRFRLALMQQVTPDWTAVFGRRILESKPDIAIDLIRFILQNAQQLVGALREEVRSHSLKFLAPVQCSTVNL